MDFRQNEPRASSYRNRLTREVILEKVFNETRLRLLYESTFGFAIFKLLINNLLFNKLYGYYQTLPFTRRKIATFVSTYQINTEDIELPLEQYTNFNAFFTRRLKPQTRAFDPTASVFCSPADGKVRVYPKVTPKTCMPIKGYGMNLEALFASQKMAQRYYDGSALIIRLAPYDYHRFHFPDAGIAQEARLISGQYHSVNAIAHAKVPGIFLRNKRAVTLIESRNFGTIAYLEIGALTVGSIVQTFTPGQVQKGQEKGYFQFGGSTLILLFEPNKILFDDDLLQDSAHNLEVQIFTGNQIGQTAKP